MLGQLIITPIREQRTAPLASQHIGIAAGFVYLAVILDSWSRLVVGYAMGWQIDTRFTLAALRAAVADRQPLPGCIHHSDRDPIRDN